MGAIIDNVKTAGGNYNNGDGAVKVNGYFTPDAGTASFKIWNYYTPPAPPPVPTTSINLLVTFLFTNNETGITPIDSDIKWKISNPGSTVTTGLTNVCEGTSGTYIVLTGENVVNTQPIYFEMTFAGGFLAPGWVPVVTSGQTVSFDTNTDTVRGTVSANTTNLSIHINIYVERPAN